MKVDPRAKKALIRSRHDKRTRNATRAAEKQIAVKQRLIATSLPHATFVEIDSKSADSRIDVRELESAGLWVKTFGTPHVLRLAGYEIDVSARTVSPEPPPSLRYTPDEAEQSHVRLVFTRAPIHPGLIGTLRAHDLEIVEALSEFALLVRASPDRWKAAFDQNDVSRQMAWIPFHPAFRLRQSVLSRLLSEQGKKGRDCIRFVAVVHEGDADELVTALARGGATSLSFATRGYGQRRFARAYARGALTLVASLTRLEGVRWIDTLTDRLVPDGERSDQILARNFVPGSDPPEPRPFTYETWLGWRGVNGSGVRVAVCDSGVYGLHPSLRGAVVARINYGTDPDIDAQGHGTHVAGIVAGRPVGHDADGFDPGIGVAPGAELVSIRALANDMEFPPAGTGVLSPWARPTADAVRAGAAVMNLSWSEGGLDDVDYTETCAELDALVRHADPEDANSAALTIVFSAGNNGPSAESLTAPKALKNAIVVGSTETAREHTDSDNDDVRDLANSSSRGRTADGRVAPLVVAPGCEVSSARTLYCDGAGSSACAKPEIHTVYGTKGVRYVVASGTSMAAPHVAGACALLIERWAQAFGAGERPSPAMLKALLVSSATDMSGGWSNDEGEPIEPAPNGDQGWGLVDLQIALGADALTFKTSRVLVDDPGQAFDGPGQQRSWKVEVIDPDQPLSLALVWTDAPGPTGVGDRALVNDLDLEVEEVGVATPAIYKGNVSFEGGFSLPAEGEEADATDNVECIRIETPVTNYKVTVHAESLIQNAKLSESDAAADLENPWQDFALVVLNARITT